MTAGSDASAPVLLTGYCDAFSYAPGTEAIVYATGDGPTRIGVARLRGRVTDGRASVEFTPVAAEQTRRLTPQRTRSGSLLRIEDPWPASPSGALELSLWLHDNAPEGTPGLVAAWRWNGIPMHLIIDADRLSVSSGLHAAPAARVPVGTGWQRITVTVDAAGSTVELRTDDAVSRGELTAEPDETAPPILVIGSDLDAVDGRLDADVARLIARVRTGTDVRELGRWDLGAGDRGDVVRDESGNGREGRLFQNPERAVPGPGWTRNEVDPRLAPSEFDATRFHRDDVTDAGWSESARIPIAADLPSGVYAVTLDDGVRSDHVPFVVRPRRRARVALLLSTFTYLAYANADLGDRIDYAAAGISGRDYLPGERDRQIHENPLVQGSLYDVHSDGLGRCFSGHRRPIFNYRADFESAVQQAPRHLGADLLLLEWLERTAGSVDVITDHDLHREGLDALKGYRVLVTSSHPEYVSARMLDALEGFQSTGGGLMYLGGNGFYWVTGADAPDARVIEVRRGNAGTRTWDSPAGEAHLSLTGEPGGLWRHRGRSPNRLVGIGMASQGWDERASAFVTDPATVSAPETRWLFDGMSDPSRFGQVGLVMDGASGDELDRWDPACGSPRDVVRVATSERHSSHYMLVHEDVLMTQHGLGGDRNDDVRSDIVWYRTASGSPVFSVGSITWAGAVAYADFDNDCAVLSTNVLRHMLQEVTDER